VNALRAAGVHVERAEDVVDAVRALGRRGIHNLLIEGGGVLAGRLLAAGLVDRLFLITAPILLGEQGVPAFGALPGARLADVARWRVAGRRALGPDTLVVLDRPA
jgi:riboflavin biosynthesis pyrimidine reductase